MSYLKYKNVIAFWFNTVLFLSANLRADKRANLLRQSLLVGKLRNTCVDMQR